MIDMKATGYKSLVGIALVDGGMNVALIARNGGGLKMQKCFFAPLSLDPLTNDPELVGREIRGKLDEQHIRESRCVVCVPFNWMLTQQIDLPELSEEDEKEYVNLHVEREFPFHPDDLSVSVSRYSGVGIQRGTITAVPYKNISSLKKVIKSAKLNLVGVTAAIASIQDIDSNKSKVIIQGERSGIELVVFAGGGVAAMRRLTNLFEDDDSGQDSLDSLTRDIRITLGRLSNDLKEELREFYIVGDERVAQYLTDSIGPSADRWGMSIATENGHKDYLSSSSIDVRLPFVPLIDSLSGYLTKGSAVFEFLPPRVSGFKQITQRIASRGNLCLGAAACAFLIITIAAFGYQYFQLTQLDSQWELMADRVTEIEKLQNNIRQFRSWYDFSAPSLSSIRTLVRAFPEEGSVWIKSLKIDDQSQVACTGFARSNREWLSTIDRLQNMESVKDFQLKQFQGKVPLGFMVEYQWIGGFGND